MSGPDEARRLYGKSINLVYDDQLYVNSVPLVDTITALIAVSGPFLSAQQYFGRYQKVGNKVTLEVSGVLDASAAAGAIINSTNPQFIPLAFKPTVPALDYKIRNQCTVFDGGVEVDGWIQLTIKADGTNVLSMGVAPFPTAFGAGPGNCGLCTTLRAVISYSV